MITIKNYMINPNLIAYTYCDGQKDTCGGDYNIEVHFINGYVLVLCTKDKAELESWKALLKG